MLKAFSVKGYRSFRNRVTLDFARHHDYNWHNDARSGDSYITNGIISNALLLGENATGKTNLGRALIDIKDNFVRSSARLGIDEYEDASFLHGDSPFDYAEFEYTFVLGGKEVAYTYWKDNHLKVVSEALVIDGERVFKYDARSETLDRSGFSLIGADGLNWDFADDELSLLGYLSNSLPKRTSPLIYALRRFVDGMGLLAVPTRAARFAMVHSLLRPIVRSEELVSELESFLRSYGVDERLEVVDGPDGSPVLYFKHKRRVPFARACSSGTLTLLMLFSRFVMRKDAEIPTLLYIDEFDAYLHYGVAEKLVSFFGSVDACQTICSTHNTSLVKNVTMRPDCVFEITREYADSSEDDHFDLLIKSLADRTAREIRRINNVEHLLRNGEFD